MEPTSQNNDINAIQETRQLLNELRSNLSHEEINRIREKLYKRESDYNSLKEKEQKDSLTNEEKKVLKNIDRYLKNISMHLKSLKKHFKKLMHLKRLESFLMNVEVIFYVKKQMKLKKLYKKEVIYNFLKEKEQEGSLTNREKRMLKNIDKYLKNFKKDLEKLQKYQYNITYVLDYLLNDLIEVDYYKPTEVKSAFDGSYILYESKGDKDNK